MKFTTTKQNTYNTIPKRATDNIFKKALDKEYNTTERNTPPIGCQYLIDRYANYHWSVLLAQEIEQDKYGELAPSIQ